MAATVNVPGAALIKIDANQGSGIESLGYSINGVEIIENSFFSDVPGDQNGGDEGPPIAIQYFGETATIRMELSKWDTAVADKIRGKTAGTSAGAIATSGTILDGSGTNFFRLIIVPTSLPINFPFAIPRQPIEHNKGTKFSRLTIEWEAHAVSGVLYNTTTT